MPALQWDSYASSLFSLGFPNTNRTFQPPMMSTQRLRIKAMIWGSTLKMFKSEKRWVFYKENETTVSLLSLRFPQGGRCLIPGFWQTFVHLRHEDHRKERAERQMYTES